MKILIVIDSLRIGGIQNSLISLLSKIDYEKCDVDLLSFQRTDIYSQKIPDKVNIVKTTSFLDLLNTPLSTLKKKNFFKFLIRCFLSLFSKIFSSILVYKFAFLGIRIKKIYDVAISYTNNGSNKSLYFGSNMFVLKKVHAKKKISWLHVDYSKMKMDTKINKKEYLLFDKIVCVSKAVETELIHSIPALLGKTEVIYNIVDAEAIYKKSNEKYHSELFSEFTIVTVSRIDQNKNIRECLNVAEKLEKKHITFKWLILGDGPERHELQFQCEKKGLTEHFIFLGYIENPYPYIKNADLYVSTSLSESFGLSIFESLVLSTPVVAREFPALHEYLKDGENGYIVSGGTDEIVDIVERCIISKGFIPDVKKTSSFMNLNARSLHNFYKVIKDEK